MSSSILKIVVVLFSLGIVSSLSVAQETTEIKSDRFTFEMPAEYLDERIDIPSFWLSTNEEVANFLNETVKKGKIDTIGLSAGGRPIIAVSYGKARSGIGTTTLSGAFGYGDIGAYRGPDHAKVVYLGIAGVHGFELEGIVGMVNLISIIETGKDLRGKEWSEITEVANKLDRLVLIPLAGPDGRARVPVRMEKYRGTDYKVHEFLNTGGYSDGEIFGWPEVKRAIPLDFNYSGFPGGYPNDAGVNIMHDNFFGDIQPETRGLFALTEKEKPDLIINMHTGAVYMNLQRPFCNPAMQPVFDNLYKGVHTRLAKEGLLNTTNIEVESVPGNAEASSYNLDTALNLHCGALSVVVESPSHGFSGKIGDKVAFHAPEALLDAQLLCHLEAMKFLVDSGGISRWITK